VGDRPEDGAGAFAFFGEVLGKIAEQGIVFFGDEGGHEKSLAQVDVALRERCEGNSVLPDWWRRG